MAYAPPDWDIYEELGVSPGASRAKVQKAYRSMMLKHHSDRQKGTDEKAKRINISRDTILNSEELRIYHDRVYNVKFKSGSRQSTASNATKSRSQPKTNYQAPPVQKQPRWNKAGGQTPPKNGGSSSSRSSGYSGQSKKSSWNPTPGTWRTQTSGSAGGQKPPGGTGPQPFWQPGADSTSHKPPPNSSNPKAPPRNASSSTGSTSGKSPPSSSGTRPTPPPHPGGPKRPPLPPPTPPPGGWTLKRFLMLFGIIALSFTPHLLITALQVSMANDGKESYTQEQQKEDDKPAKKISETGEQQVILQERKTVADLDKTYNAVTDQVENYDYIRNKLDRCQQQQLEGSGCEWTLVYSSRLKDAELDLKRTVEGYNLLASRMDPAVVTKYGYPLKLGPDGNPVA